MVNFSHFESAKAFVAAALEEKIITKEMIEQGEVELIVGIANRIAAEINAAMLHTINPATGKPLRCNRLSASDISAEIKVILYNQKRDMLEKLKKDVTGPIKSDLLKEYLTRYTTSDHHDLAMLQHLMQQVLRGLHHLPQSNQKLLGFYGKEGVGKSVWLRHLLKPFTATHTCMSQDLDAILDDRQAPALANAFVAFCDELTRFDKTDANKFKAVVTSEFRDCRLMHQNITVQIPNRIGAYFAGTNYPLASINTDPTSARRLYEIHFTGDKRTNNSQALVDGIREYNVFEMWQSIDLHKNYLSPHELVIKNRQEVLKAEDTILDFADELSIRRGTEKIAIAEVYSMYQRFCQLSGIKNVKTKSMFCKEVKNKLNLNVTNPAIPTLGACRTKSKCYEVDSEVLLANFRDLQLVK